MMINESTINKLIEMHLTAMADAFRMNNDYIMLLVCPDAF